MVTARAERSIQERICDGWTSMLPGARSTSIAAPPIDRTCVTPVVRSELLENGTVASLPCSSPAKLQGASSAKNAITNGDHLTIAISSSISAVSFYAEIAKATNKSSGSDRLHQSSNLINPCNCRFGCKAFHIVHFNK